MLPIYGIPFTSTIILRPLSLRNTSLLVFTAKTCYNRKTDIVKGERKMDRKTYGLVLCGGGGKGAYQIGVWKALRELHMDGWIQSVSGSSAGALNAMLFLNGDYAAAEHVWTSIRPIQFLDIEPEGYCSREGILKLMNRELNLQHLSESTLPTYLSVTHAAPALHSENNRFDSAMASLNQDPSERTGEYLLVNGRSAEDIQKILLASTAIPLVYDPVEIDGQLYRDGGLFDNVPIRPHLETGIKNLIIVRCSPNQQCDPYLLSQADSLLEIAPSADIGSLLTGTLDFDGRNAMYRLQLGYFDTLRTVEYYDRKMLGYPPSEAEKRTRIAQDYERAKSVSRIAGHMDDVNRNKSKIDSIMKKYGL